MNKMITTGCWCAAFAIVIASTVQAANVGDQILPVDLKGKSRYAIVYENVERDVEVDSGSATISKVDYDALYLRVHTDVGDVASLDFDLGGVDPSGGDLTYYVGAGLRILAYDSDLLRLSLMAQGHYVPIETEKGGEKNDYDLFEVEVGFFVSHPIGVEKQLRFMPYVGPVLSVVRLDGDSTVAGIKQDFDAEEDSMLGLAAGITAHVRDQHSMQFEVRYFDALSFSVGVALAF